MSDARRRAARLRDPGPHLVPGQLAALTRLCALRDLDLQVVGVDQVFTGHPETPRSHLLDRAPAQVAVRVPRVAVGILAAFAGVGTAPDAVHGDRERLVRLL
jgi:hypothetical protein